MVNLSVASVPLQAHSPDRAGLSGCVNRSANGLAESQLGHLTDEFQRACGNFLEGRPCQGAGRPWSHCQGVVSTGWGSTKLRWCYARGLSS